MSVLEIGRRLNCEALSCFITLHVLYISEQLGAVYNRPTTSGLDEIGTFPFEKS